jgi:CheY-like chemotaxis protein
MTTRAVVIDGDAARLEQTTHAFTAAGFAVAGCARAEDAVAVVKEAPSALVVLSDDFPGGAATRVLAALRRDKATRDATYLVLTSGAPHEVAAAMAEHDARAHDFAPRQTSPADLVTRAKRLLASQGVATGGIAGYSIGVTGNPDGSAKAATVAASAPLASPATPRPKVAGPGAGAPGTSGTSGTSANARGPVAISYSTGGGDKTATKTALTHGAMGIHPTFDAGAVEPQERTTSRAPEKTAETSAATAAHEKMAALVARAAAADDVEGKVAALEQALAIAYDELEDMTTAVLTAEKIVEFDPGHVTAVTFLREVYKQLGATDKLAAVEAGFRRAVTGR